ncbi:MAG TPA: lysylphosphatidylglycerol synthase transmembrane domain-containing protein [Vicinamibacterales bacterium]
MSSDAAAPTAPTRVRGRKRGALLSLLVSGGLIYLLYRTLNLRQVGEALLTADRLWLVISIAMILPITALRAIRFFWVAPAGALPGIGEAFRLTLVSAALNVFVPAKAGDLIKSYFVAKRGRTTTGVAIAIIVYERLCDMFGLIFWCLLGWFVGRPEVTSLPTAFWLLLGGLGALCGILILSETAAGLWRALMMRMIPEGGARARKLRKVRQLAVGWPDLLEVLRSRRQWIVPFSLLLWFAHLFQIWLFTITLSLHVPFTVCASLSAIALMAGQLPLTVAGLGTRDVALVVLLAAYVAPESAAAMGVLISTRNFLPPLIGLPFMRPYLASVVDDARRWRRGAEQTQ